MQKETEFLLKRKGKRLVMEMPNGSRRGIKDGRKNQAMRLAARQIGLSTTTNDIRVMLDFGTSVRVGNPPQGERLSPAESWKKSRFAVKPNNIGSEHNSPYYLCIVKTPSDQKMWGYVFANGNVVSLKIPFLQDNAQYPDCLFGMRQMTAANAQIVKGITHDEITTNLGLPYYFPPNLEITTSDDPVAHTVALSIDLIPAESTFISRGPKIVAGFAKYIRTHLGLEIAPVVNPKHLLISGSGNGFLVEY